jgi:hypothetical protein
VGSSLYGISPLYRYDVAGTDGSDRYIAFDSTGNPLSGLDHHDGGRRWLPRHIDIDRLSDEEIQDIVITANLTPRKCLGFKTPFPAILKELGKDAQIRFS